VKALAFVLCAACGASVATPALAPNLATMPEDGDARDHLVDTAMAQPSAEQQPVSKKARREETAAATAAAILGMMFSRDDNVIMGIRMDENQVLDKQHAFVPVNDHGSGGGSGTGSGSAAQLVPWVKVGR
jgi:hypothetical protein